MTGRQKIQAALSPAGSAQFPVVICYEDIYIRDHWDQLTACPWWYSHSPDLKHQLAWRRDVIARTGQDWFVVSPCHSRTERQNLHIEERDGRVFRINRQTGQDHELFRPQVAGWALGTEVQSVHPE